MKANVYIEYQGNKIATKDLTEKMKELWKEQGKKVKDLSTIDLYVKPEEGKCYYVINETDSGSFSI